MLRCDRVSASTSRGETPSFFCSRAAIPEEPGHSNAGSVTDEGEDWSAAWREASGTKVSLFLKKYVVKYDFFLKKIINLEIMCKF